MVARLEEGVLQMVTLIELLANLPPEPDETRLFRDIQQAVAASNAALGKKLYADNS